VFDKLEMLYDQAHYKVVYHKSKQLLDKPDYDFSYLPQFYKSLSMFQLSQNKSWFRRNPKALKEASELYLEVMNSTAGEKIFKAHQDELIDLKIYLNEWLETISEESNPGLVDQLKIIVSTTLKSVPSSKVKVILNKPLLNTSVLAKDRKELIDYASKLIGSPYVSAGQTPNGFDCSGFSSYVFSKIGIDLPRRAADQESNSTKVKFKNLQQGDLIFFNNGGGVSHVGIVVEVNETELKMIHSSSSKGIIITEVLSSNYWKNRIHSYGTYFK